MIITVETKKTWQIVHTRSGCEKKVATLLEKKKLEVYCPLNKFDRQWMDRKKIMAEPLFSSYVFINVAEADCENVLLTDGVINFVYWLRKPAIVQDEEIETIKRFLSEYDHVGIEKAEVLPDTEVKILNGPLVFWEGNIVEVRTNTVKIFLPSLGYSLVAEIKKESLLDTAHNQYDIKKVI